jgi:hypothetical protein
MYRRFLKTLATILVYTSLLMTSFQFGYNLFLFVSYCLLFLRFKSLSPVDLIDDFFPYKQESLILGIPLGIVLALLLKIIYTRFKLNDAVLLFSIFVMTVCLFLGNTLLNYLLRNHVYNVYTWLL